MLLASHVASHDIELGTIACDGVLVSTPRALERIVNLLQHISAVNVITYN